MDGLLVIDKPAGMTSHDVVDRVRSIFEMKRVGHGGTLDPDATGVLLVGLGGATRLLSYTQQGLKRYRAVARFGITTTTQDGSGEIEDQEICDFDRSDLEITTKRFVGEVKQLPPMVSAVKVAGERLHKLARMGKEVERKERPVTIDSIDVVDFTPGDNPTATLDVRCSGGTYIRTLVHDIGRELGCGAHVARLRRTESGGFGEDEAIALDDVHRDSLRPAADAVRGLNSFEVDATGIKGVSNGRPIDLAGADLPGVDDGDAVAIAHRGNLLAVYVRKGERLTAERVIAHR